MSKTPIVAQNVVEMYNFYADEDSRAFAELPQGTKDWWMKEFREDPWCGYWDALGNPEEVE